MATTPARTQEAAVVWTQQTPDGARILFDAEYPVGGFDIVVADSQLEAAVASLAAWKESIGYRVSVISVPTIFEIYGTGDDAERIYAYLADRSADVRHVLLVGDVDLLPMRMLYPSDTRPAYGSDFYYADAGNLNWDHDLDGRWGEFVDDALDPNPDLIVGRAPFDDPADVQAFCSGVIAFEQATGAWKRDVLLANGFLDHVEGWAGDPVTDTAYASERIIGDVLAPRGWGSATLYEKIGISTSPFSCDADLLQANFLSRIGWGRHGLVSTNAHGDPGSKAGLQWMSDINGNFVRDLPEESRYNSFSNWGDIAAHPAAGAVCLWGCSTGVVFGDFAGFAGSPLRSRYLIRTPRSNTMMKEYLRHGAGAVVASTAGADYSPGWTQPGDGRIQSLSYYFFEQLGEGPRRIGDAFYAASVKYASVHGLARGLRVFHVFGDPTLSVDDITLPPGSRESALLSWQARIAPTVSISDRRRTDSFEATSREPASPGPVPQGGEMPPLVWDQVTRPAESIAILSLERVGDVLLAGGIRRGATGNQGTIFRSTDQGDSWVPQDFPGVASIRVVERTGSGRLVAGGMG
ncbi:MAG: C25 family cysteine peptidase, partial [Candidatus Eisenbacteria bacterium]